MAFEAEKGHLFSALAALLGALLIQIGTNLSNDYFDFGNSNVYLVSHNGDNFDMRFLNQHFEIKCKHIDNLKFFKKLLNESNNSLKYLCNLFKINT